MDAGAIFLTAVVGGVASQTFSYVKDWWTWKRDGRFSSLYAALFFEEYASESSRMLAEMDAFEASDGYAGNDHGRIAPLAPFPNSIEWKRISLPLTEKAFGFQVEVQAANSRIAAIYEYEDSDAATAEVHRQCVILGLAALSIARKLRIEAKLGAAPIPNPEWTVERHLTERQADFERIRLDNLRRQEEARVARLALDEAAGIASPE